MGGKYIRSMTGKTGSYKESITVRDYLKFQRCHEADRSITPHVNHKYKHGYWNVFLYDQILQKWLDDNDIDYRINYEEPLVETQKPYKNDN